MNMNSEFNYFLISGSRDPSACQETPLLSKKIVLLSWGPHSRAQFCPPKPACLAGKFQRFPSTSWQTCSSQQYVTQYFWKLFSYFLKTGADPGPTWTYGRNFPSSACPGEFSGWKDKGQSRMGISEFFIFQKAVLASSGSNLYSSKVSYLPLLGWKRKKKPKEKWSTNN